MTTDITPYAKEVPHWTWDAIWACQTDRQRRICILIQQEQFHWSDEKRHGKPVKLSQDAISRKTGIRSRNHVNNVVNELRRLGLVRTVRGSHTMTYELLPPDVPMAGTSDEAPILQPDVPTEGTSDVPTVGTLDVPKKGTHNEKKSSTEVFNGSLISLPTGSLTPVRTEGDGSLSAPPARLFPSSESNSVGRPQPSPSSSEKTNLTPEPRPGRPSRIAAPPSLAFAVGDIVRRLPPATITGRIISIDVRGVPVARVVFEDGSYLTLKLSELELVEKAAAA